MFKGFKNAGGFTLLVNTSAIAFVEETSQAEAVILHFVGGGKITVSASIAEAASTLDTTTGDDEPSITMLP